MTHRDKRKTRRVGRSKTARGRGPRRVRTAAPVKPFELEMPRAAWL